MIQIRNVGTPLKMWIQIRSIMNKALFFCCRYELASGDSHFRQGKMGKGLKKYLSVEKHYNDMVEDQFDFHTYCLRKMTLRAYIRMLRFQDHLHSHRFFSRAAGSAIRYVCRS